MRAGPHRRRVRSSGRSRALLRLPCRAAPQPRPHEHRFVRTGAAVLRQPVRRVRPRGAPAPGLWQHCGRLTRKWCPAMLTFLLWLFLLLFCWPLAIAALLLYPIVWLLLLPFRLLGITIEGLFALLRAIVMLPARVLSGAR